MGFLARSGLDSIKLAGHKVPIGLIAAGVGLAGVVVVLRARQQGHQVGSVGQAPGSAAETGFGLPLPGTDPGAQLANISAQLTSLSQSINGPPSSTGSGTAGGITAGSSFWNSGLIPIYSPHTANLKGNLSSVQIGGIPGGTHLTQKGAPLQVPPPRGGGWPALIPVDYLGSTALVSSSDITI